MKKTLYILGALLVFLGVLGFFQNPVLGVFDFNSTLSSVYTVVGLAVFGFLYKAEKLARTYILVLGLIFLLSVVLGLVQNSEQSSSVLQLSSATIFLQLLFSIFMLGAGMHQNVRSKN